MSPLRAPTVGGLAGGVGATTVARALHAREIGRVGDAGRLPDVVVCRATVSGLALAGRRVGRTPAPVLAVTAVGGDPDERVVERLAAVGEAWAGPVVLPPVRHWDAAEDPYDEVAGLLGAKEPPSALTGYAEALRGIVALLTASGRLERDDGWDAAGALRPVRGIRVGVAGTAW